MNKWNMVSGSRLLLPSSTIMFPHLLTLLKNKWTESWCLKATEMYSVRVLEVGIQAWCHWAQFQVSAELTSSAGSAPCLCPRRGLPTSPFSGLLSSCRSNLQLPLLFLSLSRCSLLTTKCQNNLKLMADPVTSFFKSCPGRLWHSQPQLKSLGGRRTVVSGPLHVLHRVGQLLPG